MDKELSVTGLVDAFPGTSNEDAIKVVGLLVHGADRVREIPPEQVDVFVVDTLAVAAILLGVNAVTQDVGLLAGEPPRALAKYIDLGDDLKPTIVFDLEAGVFTVQPWRTWLANSGSVIRDDVKVA